MAIVGGKPLRIFIIGPMHESEDRSGLSYTDHTENIKRAAEIVLRELVQSNPDRMPFCEVIAPPDSAGDIVQAVFPHIFHCDIAIADISSGSANVYYELAILHSLGIPVVLLTEGRHADFYMLHNNVVNLASFEVEAIAEGLRGKRGSGHLEQIILEPNEAQRSNPITRFLNRIPLVHFSAVSGIANGQFANFIYWVVKKDGVLTQLRSYKSLILVRPTRVLSVDEDVRRLEDVFGEEVMEGRRVKQRNGRPVRELAKFWHPEQTHPRDGIMLRRIGDCLIDYPTPISSLPMSRQYQDAAEYYRSRSRSVDRAGLDAESDAYEQSLIDTYIALLWRLIETTHGCDPRKFEVLTVEQIIKRFGVTGG